MKHFDLRPNFWIGYATGNSSSYSCVSSKRPQSARYLVRDTHE